MHAMTLSDLRYLVVLAEEGNFRRAADRCHVTQPTLSGQIKKIEAMLEVSLFERGARRLRVTAIGEKIVGEARKILLEAEQLMDLAKSHKGPLVGELRLGIIPTLCPYLLPWLVPSLHAAYADLKLRIREDLTANLLAALRGFSADAHLLALPVPDSELVSAPLFDEPFWFVCHPRHPLAGLSEVREDDLVDSGLILLNEGHCLREQALAVCGHRVRHGAMVGSDLRAASLETARQMVAAGMGCTLMPALSLKANPEPSPRIEIRPFGARDTSRRIGLVWRRSYPRGDDMERLADFIRGRLPDGVTAITPSYG
jgi:LysR family hydrogen peroxide-inducible transcriptional activator